ncbi:MAG TPA: hypothetical protein VGN81_04415 [Pseudonocardiaceae bacterium]
MITEASASTALPTRSQTVLDEVEAGGGTDRLRAEDEDGREERGRSS